jgi:transposase
MSKPRRKYDRSYKLRVIEKSYECDSIADLARQLGLKPAQIYNWRSAYSKDKEGSFPGEGNKSQSPEEAELALLKKRLAEKDQELEILKKAIGIFSKRDGKSLNL